MPLVLAICLVLSGFGAVAISENAENDYDEYDLVIIAPSKFTDDLRKLVDHKNSIGVNTTLKTTEEIYDNFTGVDKPEQIKYFIKDAMETWGIDYALLVGGLKSYFYAKDRDNANEGSRAWHVPVRYTNLYVDGGYEAGCISDLYYADIYDDKGNFSSWDSNGDGIFAAWDKPGVPNDELDLYPDISVGRLPCRNKFEVEIMVNKIITYENSSDKDWFNKMVVVAGYGYGGDRTDEEICDHALAYMPDFDPIRVYASNSDTGGPVPRTKDIIKAINSGCGFLLFEGMGNPGKWATYLDEHGWPGGISVYAFPRLRNGKKLPVCIVGGAAHVCLFNITLIKTLLGHIFFQKYRYYGPPNIECFGWWMTRKIGGGSIATIASTGLVIRYLWIYPLLELEFFQSYASGIHVLGRAHTMAIINYLDKVIIDKIECKTVQEWILFGDPSLTIGGYS